MPTADDDQPAGSGSADAPDIAAQLSAARQELADALALQTATSEVLRLINEHPGDVRVVLDTVLWRVAELCDAQVGAILVENGDQTEVVAALNLDIPIGHRAAGGGRTHQASLSTGESIRRGSPELLDDYLAVEHFDPVRTDATRRANLRSSMAIPMFHEGELVGVFTVGRTEVRPFGPADVHLGEAFAQQAAIAISNAKLFHDLDAALERQTASAEVMRVISSSPGDLERTLPEIARTAKRLSNAWDIAITFGNRDGVTVWDERRGFTLMDGSSTTPGLNKILDDVVASGRPAQLVGSVDSWLAENPTPASILKGDGTRMERSCSFPSSAVRATSVSSCRAETCRLRSRPTRSVSSKALPIRPSSPSTMRGSSPDWRSATTISPGRWSYRRQRRKSWR